MIRKMLENELAFERMLLKKLSAGRSGLSDLLLTMSSGGKFYYRKKGSTERKYIRKSNRKLLRQIAGSRFIAEKIKTLETNVLALEDVLAKFSEYDDDSIINSLPKAYSCAVSFLRSGDAPPEVIQSENPTRRNELTVVCSNGLKVRTKVEMIIAEMLIALDIEFRYEKGIDLVRKIPQEDGTFRYKPITLYPDFTIILADGTELYWEHAGLFDQESYKDWQHIKFDIYYYNGIYPPKNLIITMDGPDKPISSLEIRSIVEALILPRI